MTSEISRLFAAKGVATPAALPARNLAAARPAAARTSGPRKDADGASRVTLRLDIDTHERLKQAATREGKSLSETLLAALSDYVVAEAAVIGSCACLKKAEA